MIISLVSQPSFSQGKDPAYHLQKSKNLKTGGWVVLTGGLTIAAIGGLIQLHDYKAWKNDMDSWAITPDFRGMYVAITGGCIAVVSTPLFIYSGVYKRKGMYLSLNHQRLVLYDLSANKHQWIPSVSLIVRL